MDTWHTERIEPSLVEEYTDKEHKLTVLYEEPYDGYTYGCSPKDVIYLLNQLPNNDCKRIDFIVFRQPTKKQIQQNPVWGRLIYCSTIKKRVGSTIYIEAQEVGTQIKWPRKLALEDQAELQRLRESGHQIEETKRNFILTLSEDSIRNQLLYRTLLHELGHWVQYEKGILSDKTTLSDNTNTAYELYFAKPKIEHENFAHRYASETRNWLVEKELIPFGPLN